MGIDFILDELDDLQNRSLLREYKAIEGAQCPYVHINGKSYLSFCSNNYLGLANHPKIKQAAIEAIHRYGWGAGASRLVSGTMTLHQELEKKIATKFANHEEELQDINFAIQQLMIPAERSVKNPIGFRTKK